MNIQMPKNVDSFTAQFFEYAKRMMPQSKMTDDLEITPDNIYQEAHTANRGLLAEIVKKSHLEGSTILGVENIVGLYELAQKGHSCLILSEHLSNLDVPSMFVRFYEHSNEKLKEIFEKIIFVAGVKLNENPLVKLFTEMFSRIVIFPIRSLAKIMDSEEYKKDVDLAKKINLKSLRKIKELRTKGYLFVMFPAGTRYRPWNPDSKKGIKEAVSYLNSFEYFCCCSINGNNMEPMEHEDMLGERFKKDVFVLNYGEVRKAKDFISDSTRLKENKPDAEKEDLKQFIVDQIMNEIDKLHSGAEEYRKKFIR